MPTQPEEYLRTALEQSRPCVLLLGQSFEAGTFSPVLDQLAKRKDLAAEAGKELGWRQVLSKGLTAEDLQWLAERFDRTVISEAGQAVLDLPWSAIFTSSIDQRLIHRLETHGRQPEAIVTSDQNPRAPRSTARPPTYFLFGRASDAADGVRCPGSINELKRRTVLHASPLLARVKETVTPIGLVVVDGYRSQSDWLEVDTLLSVIPPEEGMVVLWFNIDEGVRTSPLFQDLEASGKLIVDPRSLSQAVTELMATGASLDRLSIHHESGVISFASGALVEIGPSLRLRVEASASIVDDEWTQSPEPLTGTAEEDLFRRVHGDFGGPRALIDGVGRGFFIERAFESKLAGAVSEALETGGAREQIFILHGQSGTGKSVALARLALNSRRKGRVPVLFSAGRIPDATDVDAFCDEIERKGQGPTLLLCDANEQIDRYLRLVDALRSRGRRIVLVGTCYRQEKTVHRLVTGIEALDTATDPERTALKELVARYEGSAAATRIAGGGKHVFALLYRELPSSRQRLASGLGAEARFAETHLRLRTQNRKVKMSLTTLGQKLVEAGLHSGEEALFEAVDEAGDSDTSSRLIDYVMVPGRIDVAVPLNLLMRALRARTQKLDYALIAEIFDGLDLFRWPPRDGERTELLVCPRLRLEAELICGRRMGSADRELDSIVDLILAVRPSSVDEDSERRFLLDLLYKLDRDGPRGKAYGRGYLRIARALTALRVNHGVDDASLMLQESSFRRAWLQFMQDQETQMPPAERDSILEEAREVVENALNQIQRGRLRTGNRTRDNLHVELASIYGYLAVGHAMSGAKADLVWADYQAARVAARRAMNIAPSYFPFDVGLWMPADIFEKAASLTDVQRAELVADIYGTLDRVQAQDLAPSQAERFDIRRHKVGATLKDAKLQESALQNLEKINPQAAIFLRARSRCPELFEVEDEVLPKEVRAAAMEAAAFIRGQEQLVSMDARCLRSLLEYEWASTMGRRLLSGERQLLPSDRDQLRKLQRIVSSLLQVTAEAQEAAIRYLGATLSWVLDDVKDAEIAWRALSRDTEYEDRRRVRRHLVVSDSSGRPKRFRGRLVELKSDGHWLLELEGTRVKVDVLERDFRDLDFRSGYEMRDFAIAFNYRGPLAEPASKAMEDLG